MSPRAVAGLAVVVGNDHEFAQLQAASVPRRHDSLASRPENPAGLAGAVSAGDRGVDPQAPAAGERAQDHPLTAALAPASGGRERPGGAAMELARNNHARFSGTFEMPRFLVSRNTP